MEQRDRGLLLCGVGIALGAAGLASIATAVSIKLLAPERSGGEHAWALHMGVGQLTLTGDGPRDPAPRCALGHPQSQTCAGDMTQKKRYVGPDCDLCNPDTGWVVMQKDLM